MKHPSVKNLKKKSSVKRPKISKQSPIEQTIRTRKLGVELASDMGIDLEKRVKEMDQQILDNFPPSETENKFATTQIVHDTLANPEVPLHIKIQISKGLQKYHDRIEKMPPGIVRAMKAHKLIDEVIEDEEKDFQDDPNTTEYQEISCKRGCSHCCHRLVGVTSDEAVLLANQLKRIGKGTITRETIQTLQKQAKYDLSQASEFFQLPLEENKCVFLTEEQDCSIYVNRPFACRTLRVRSNPFNCSQEAFFEGRDDIDPAISVEAEVIVSAALEVEDKPLQPLPRALLAQLLKQKQEAEQDKHKRSQEQETQSQQQTHKE